MATVFDIIHRPDRLGWASPNDFGLGPGRPVDDAIVAENRNWSLYTLDLDSRLAWFVELPPDLDLSQSAFVYFDQADRAIRALSVALDDLDALAARIPGPERVIFVFSIGRCGSTLVSHALNKVPAVWGLSEPMVYPRLIQDNFDSAQRRNLPREQVVELIRSCTALLFRPPEKADATVFAVKFHSQSLFQADLYHAAFPDAAFVFLYREALSWLDSLYRMMRKYGFDAAQSGDRKLSAWSVVTAAADPAELRPYADLQADHLPIEVGATIGWAYCMAAYSRLLAAGVPFLALRYSELNSSRVASLARLFGHCRLPLSATEAALRAFDVNSQAGTLIARDDKAEGLTLAQLSNARLTLSGYPGFGDPDLILPDIYSAPVAG